jgi:hypothetical protein
MRQHLLGSRQRYQRFAKNHEAKLDPKTGGSDVAPEVSAAARR